MNTSLLLDTNLLVLLVTGIADTAYIARHKRLAAFDVKDFQIVAGLADAAPALVLSPNVLTETSNLLRYASGDVRAHLSAALAKLVEKFGEQYIPTVTASGHEHYARLGVADCVLLTQAATGATLLTDDLDLYLASSRAGHDAYNYNHIREARPDYG